MNAASPRLENATTQKMIPDMLSTRVIIKLGKIVANLIVDVQATNAKLEEHPIHIVGETTGLECAAASVALGEIAPCQ